MEKIKINLEEALNEHDCSIPNDELDWVISVISDINDWTYSDYSNFASEVCQEWGDYLYVLDSCYDYIPSLYDNRSLVNDWFSDHMTQIRDVLRLCDLNEESMDDDEAYDYFESIDTEDILEWFREKGHEQAYRDVISYILRHLDLKNK